MNPRAIRDLRSFMTVKVRLRERSGGFAKLALIAGMAGTTIGLVRATHAEEMARSEAEAAHQVSDSSSGSSACPTHVRHEEDGNGQG